MSDVLDIKEIKRKFYSLFGNFFVPVILVQIYVHFYQREYSVMVFLALFLILVVIDFFLGLYFKARYGVLLSAASSTLNGKSTAGSIVGFVIVHILTAVGLSLFLLTVLH